MAWSRPDVVKSCSTIATSPNQQGTEGTTSEAIWIWTDGCVILRVFSLVGEDFIFFLLSKETHFCLVYKDFPLLPTRYLILLACCHLVAHHVGIGSSCHRSSSTGSALLWMISLVMKVN